jgi:hypothetical protein
MKKLGIKILIFFIFAACNSAKENEKITYQNIYDINLLYTYYKTDPSIGKEYLNEQYLRDGNLYLIFEANFNRDTVEIEINNEIMSKDIITTEWSAAIAKDYKFENIDKIKTVGIRINSGKKAIIEIDTMNYLLIEFRDTILNIRFPKNVPYYD